MIKIPVSRLLYLFSYDPATGSLSWRIDRGKCKAGKEITCLNDQGYIVVRADDTLLRAHRVAWAMQHGEWPTGEIDHVNGIRNDNRIENLRVANRSENMRNTKKPITNKSGKKGVSWDKEQNKWRASIRADGKTYNLGRFERIDDAFNAYKNASGRLHMCFGRHD